MPVVSSVGMSVERQPTSRLLIKHSEACSTVSSAKVNESFTIYSFLVQDFKIGTIDFTRIRVVFGLM